MIGEHEGATPGVGDEDGQDRSAAPSPVHAPANGVPRAGMPASVLARLRVWWRAARATAAARPLQTLAALGVAWLIVCVFQGGMAERLYLSSRLANVYDRAVSRSMPLAGLFRLAVGWVPRRLPAPLPGAGTAASPFLMAMLAYAASMAALFALYALALRWVGRPWAARVTRQHDGVQAAAQTVEAYGRSQNADRAGRGGRRLKSRLEGVLPRNPPARVGAGRAAGTPACANTGSSTARPVRHTAFAGIQTTADGRTMLLVAAIGALCSVVLLFTPAAPSHDPFAYAMSGRLMVTYHANPFFTVPAAYPHDPILAANDWQHSATAYGPLWSYLSVLLVPLVGADPVRANMVYRGVALLAHLANIGLLAALLSRLPARYRGWRAFGLLLYAWNPLVVVEVAAGHNDVLMLTLLLLGLYLLDVGRGLSAMLALGGAMLVKASAWPLVLLVLLCIWLAPSTLFARPVPSSVPAVDGHPAAGPQPERGGASRWWGQHLLPRHLVGYCLLLAAVLFAGYLPFYWGHTPSQIAASWGIQPTSQSLARTLKSSFGTLAGGITGARIVPAGLRPALAHAALALASSAFWTLVLALLLLGTTFLLLPAVRRHAGLPVALAAVYAMWMIFLCVFDILRTWYLVPLVGLVSLTSTGRPMRRFTLALTATMELQVFFISKSPPFDGWQPWSVLVVLVPPLAVLFVELRRAGFAWRTAGRRSLALLRARLRAHPSRTEQVTGEHAP